jgi:hypothetical protein
MSTRSVAMILARSFKAGIGAEQSHLRRVSDAMTGSLKISHCHAVGKRHSKSWACNAVLMKVNTSASLC